MTFQEALKKIALKTNMPKEMVLQKIIMDKACETAIERNELLKDWEVQDILDLIPKLLHGEFVPVCMLLRVLCEMVALQCEKLSQYTDQTIIAEKWLKEEAKNDQSQ